MDTETGMGDAIKKIEEDRRAAARVPGRKEQKPKAPAPNDGVAQTRAFIDRIVRLEEEKATLSGDIKDIYTEVKSAGFEPKAFRVLVRREMETAEERAARIAVQEEVDRLELALGAFAETALGRAAMDEARVG